MILKRNVPDKVAPAQLGHWDASMTKRYQHVLDDMERSAADALNGIVE
jgi:integrase